jgi:hypothetical protein
MEAQEKKFRKIAVISALVWAVGYILSLLAVKRFQPPLAVSLGLAAILIALFAWFLYNHIRRISYMDEMQRRIQLEATAVAFCIMLLLTMVMSLLASVGKLDQDTFSLKELVPFFSISYIGGLVWARKRYT